LSEHLVFFENSMERTIIAFEHTGYIGKH
jgi:hypothetical protein